MIPHPPTPSAKRLFSSCSAWQTVRATATALAYFGLAGEVAARQATAPGSFMIQMLDALYTITPEQLETGCKIESNE